MYMWNKSGMEGWFSVRVSKVSTSSSITLAIVKWSWPSSVYRQREFNDGLCMETTLQLFLKSRNMLFCWHKLLSIKGLKSLSGGFRLNSSLLCQTKPNWKIRILHFYTLFLIEMCWYFSDRSHPRFGDPL